MTRQTMSKEWINAIRTATPGASAESRMAISDELWNKPTYVDVHGKLVPNPHFKGETVKDMAGTIADMCIEIKPSPATLDANPRREAMMAQMHTLKLSPVPLDATEAPNKQAEFYASLAPHIPPAAKPRREAMMAQIHALKLKKAELMRDVSQVSLQIAELDMALAKDNHEAFLRKSGRPGDHHANA